MTVVDYFKGGSDGWGANYGTAPDGGPVAYDNEFTWPVAATDPLGRPVIVASDFVEGERLSGLWRGAAESKSNLPLDVLLRVLTDILSGLAALHDLSDAKGQPLKLSHGDITTANVLVGADGVSRLLHACRIRIPGALPGEEATVAPEVLWGAAADQRADVFAMGVLLWQALSNKAVLTDAGWLEHLRSGTIVRAPVPKGVPWAAPLVDVAARAMQTEPEKRFSNASAMFAEVRKIADAKLATQTHVAAFLKKFATAQPATADAALSKNATMRPTVESHAKKAPEAVEAKKPAPRAEVEPPKPKVDPPSDKVLAGSPSPSKSVPTAASPPRPAEDLARDVKPSAPVQPQRAAPRPQESTPSEKTLPRAKPAWSAGGSGSPSEVRMKAAAAAKKFEPVSAPASPPTSQRAAVLPSKTPTLRPPAAAAKTGSSPELIELKSEDAHSIPPSVPPPDEPTLVLPRKPVKLGGMIPATSERPVPLEPKVVIGPTSTPAGTVSQPAAIASDGEDVPIPNDSEEEVLEADHGQWTTSPSAPPSERQKQAPIRVELELIAAGKAVPLPSTLYDTVPRYRLMGSTPPSARRTAPPRAIGFMSSIIRAIGGASLVLAGAAAWHWYDRTHEPKNPPPAPVVVTRVNAHPPLPAAPSAVIAQPSASVPIQRTPLAPFPARARDATEPGDDLRNGGTTAAPSSESSQPPRILEP